jgi:transposase
VVPTMPKRIALSNPDRAGEPLLVFGGVDTHADTHTVAAISHLGAMLGHQSFPATAKGYRQLYGWLAGHGTLMRVGMEGTSSYGAGLAAALTGHGVELVEVNRPARTTRRARGKSDPIDAEAAARAGLAGVATAVPKTHTGVVEEIRVIFVARRGAVQARTAAINTLHQMIITAPLQLRAQLQPLTRTQQITACAALHTGDITSPTRATKLALRRLARRIGHLTAEITDATNDLTTLVQAHAPHLLTQVGVGSLSAAQLLITAGDNPDQMTSPASFAALCGTSPIPVSSGKTNRHRLNRGGDRQANCALHTIVLSRLRYHPETQAYAAKRQNRRQNRTRHPPQPEALPRPPPIHAHPHRQPGHRQHPHRHLTNHRSITRHGCR